MKSCVITTDQFVENRIKVWVSLIDEILFTLKNKSSLNHLQGGLHQIH